MKDYTRIRAEIDLSAICFNLESMKKKLPGETEIYAVVKTDGYGHGAGEIAREIADYPYVRGFCVATAEEGAALRQEGIEKEILILGHTFPENYETLFTERLMPTVFDLATAAALSKEAKERETTLPVQLAVDTGMSRIGLQVTETDADLAAGIAAQPGLSIAGVFTHFARADEADKTETRAQIERFHTMKTMLKERGVVPPLFHCANSAAIMELPEAAFDTVRAGITLYGILPSEEVDPAALALRPVMSLTSHVSHVKDLEDGRTISYGGTYTVRGTKRIATIPVGYGDGYPRSLSNTGYVLIHGKRAPICGRVCMDQFMVDVTEIPEVLVGDEVRLLGTQGEETISIADLDRLSGRFSYELACDIGKRVPRVFFRDGTPVCVREPF